MASALRAALSLLLPAALLFAQQGPPPAGADAELQAASAAFQAKWRAYTDAMASARQRGELPKGAVPPAPVAELEQEANRAAEDLLARFWSRDDLSAASWLQLARVQEVRRDYKAAVTAYERSLAKGDPSAPDLQAMGSLCIAAMNSKDEQLAARWMRRLVAEEDRRGEGVRRNLQVRTSFLPRTLIALDDWQGLDRLLAALAEDEAPAGRAAARTFGVVAALHRGNLEGARKDLAAIRADQQAFPDHQAWAVLAQLAIEVHDGRFAEGAAAVRAFLAAPEPASTSAQDRNQRRYLAAVEPFLGKPVPALRADHCVGGELTGADVLPRLRGKVVVLDFWQPWCEPCRRAMPELVAAQEQHAGVVQVLGVCKVENFGYDVSERRAVRPIAPADYPAHVEDFRRDMQLNYPLLVCGSSANSEAFRIAGVPTLVVIDREGIVRYMSCGAGEPGLFRLALAGVVGPP